MVVVFNEFYLFAELNRAEFILKPWKGGEGFSFKDEFGLSKTLLKLKNNDYHFS